LGKFNFFITFVTPGIAKKLGLKVVKPLISNFFIRIVKDTVEYREKNNIHRKDFMHLLLQLKNRGKLDEHSGILKEIGDDKESNLSINELAAQAFVFFLAGFETLSTTMTFCLFELASNPDIQEKLRQEIYEVLKRHDNKLTYDATMEMHYMEKVINGKNIFESVK
jgi:cytochrome P450 family 6